MTTSANTDRECAQVEDVAKIIDPDAWHDTLPADGCGAYWSMRRMKALSKAEMILAALSQYEDKETDNG